MGKKRNDAMKVIMSFGSAVEEQKGVPVSSFNVVLVAQG